MAFKPYDGTWVCEDCKYVIKKDVVQGGDPQPPVPPGRPPFIWICKRFPQCLGVAQSHWCYEYDE